MQDDFKVPTPPSVGEPTPPDSPIMPPNNTPVAPTPAIDPVPPAPSAPPLSDSPVPEPAPVSPPANPLPSLTPSDPGPIPPATSMNFTPGQVSGPVVGGGPSVSGPVIGGSSANAPVVGGPVVGGPVTGGPFAGTPQPDGKPKKKKLLLFSGIAAAVVLLLAAAYVFAIYLPNTPGHVYSSSLSNSGLALDRLIQYSQQQEHASYTTTKFTGTVQVKSPSGSYDATLNGAIDKNANANIQSTADIMGEKLAANILSIKTAGDTTPDIYVQVTGIKSMLDSLGLNSYDKLDGQWIVVDHTLIDTYLSATTGQNKSSSGGAPTYADVEDALTKVQSVNKQYLFTTDSTKAVLTNQKFIAKESSGGRVLDHYKVGYNKAHLSAYLAAVGQALNSSKLNTWYKSASSNNNNLSDELDITKLQNEAKNANGNYTFDLWADTKTKLVAKISFADPSDKSSVFSVGQNYTGGSSYPFVFGFTGKDSSGNAQAASLGITLDTNTNKATITFTANSEASNGTTNVSGDISVTPSNTPVSVTAPKNAESFTNLLLSLGLSSLANGNLGSNNQPTSQSIPFAVTE